VIHRGDRVRDAAADEADGSGRTASLPTAEAQAAAAAPVQGPTLLRLDADSGAVLQVGCCIGSDAIFCKMSSSSYNF